MKLKQTATRRYKRWMIPSVALATLCAGGCNPDLTVGQNRHDAGIEGPASGTGGGGGSIPLPGTSVVFDSVERTGGRFPVGGALVPAVGNWESVSQDGALTQQVIAAVDPPRDASHFALRFGGGTQSATVIMATWAVSGSSGGSGGFDGSSGTDGGSSPYELDFRAYSGFSFWARTSAGVSTFVFAVSDNAASPFRPFFLTEGTTDAWPSIKLTATAEWQRYTVLFDDLRRSHPPVAGSPLAADSVTGIHFVTSFPPVELWIDEISLLCRGKC